MLLGLVEKMDGGVKSLSSFSDSSGVVANWARGSKWHRPWLFLYGILV